MEQKILQRQQEGSLIYFASENKHFKKTKTNVILVVVIVSLGVSMRLSGKKQVFNIYNGHGGQFINMPSPRTFLHIVPGKIA